MKSRSYLRAMSDAAAPSPEMALLRPSSRRIWPLQPMSGYVDRPALDSAGALPMRFAMPAVRSNESTSGKGDQPTDAPTMSETGSRHDRSIDVSMKVGATDAAIPEPNDSGKLHEEKARPNPSRPKPSGVETRLDARPDKRLDESSERRRLRPLPASSLATDRVTVAPESRQTQTRPPSLSSALVPDKPRHEHAEAISETREPHETRGKAADPGIGQPQLATQSSRPWSPDSQKITVKADTPAAPQNQRQVRQNTTVETALLSEPPIVTAGPPSVAPATTLPLLLPEENPTSKRTTYAHTTPRSNGRQGGPPNTVHIGTIEIRIAPPPPMPATRPVFRQAPASPSEMLARGFTSEFGLRQG